MEHPFNLHQVALFSTKELRPKWISGELDLECRQKKIRFSAIPGKTLSLYAKVEKCEFEKGNLILIKVIPINSFGSLKGIFIFN